MLIKRQKSAKKVWSKDLRKNERFTKKQYLKSTVFKKKVYFDKVKILKKTLNFKGPYCKIQTPIRLKLCGKPGRWTLFIKKKIRVSIKDKENNWFKIKKNYKKSYSSQRNARYCKMIAIAVTKNKIKYSSITRLEYNIPYLL